MMLLTKVYPSSYTKVRGLILELEKLNIKEIPGENITTLVQKASDLVREIQMNFLCQDQIPDLCVSATTPSTLGKAASACGLVWREKWSAMARAAVAEQFTLVSTPM